MANGLGSNFIARDLSSHMNGASGLIRPRSDEFQTPAKIKLTCAVEEVRYFAVMQDPTFWNSPAYGIVALDRDNFQSLVQDGKCSDIYTTITQAKERADAVNLALYEHSFGRRTASPAGIAVPAPVNQTLKI